jgi:hypothetical protein
MMYSEFLPPAPNVLFATLVTPDDDELGKTYAVTTVLHSQISMFMKIRSEEANDITPKGDPRGMFQTTVYGVVEDEDGNRSIDPYEILGVIRSTIGREAVMIHDKVEEVDQGKHDPTQDPFYEVLQVRKLHDELDSFDINELSEEDNEGL